ncbi:MAG: hypothetical protein C0172_03050 [Caldisphaera sp.]|nr:MAG: hypothetical protein C0172_03050 [Caldisphaera sp.]
MSKEEAVKILKQYLLPYEIDMVFYYFETEDYEGDWDFDIRYEKEGADWKKIITIGCREEWNSLYLDVNIEYLYEDDDVVRKDVIHIISDGEGNYDVKKKVEYD